VSVAAALSFCAASKDSNDFSLLILESTKFSNV
jgi:hypothetical protein